MLRTFILISVVYFISGHSTAPQLTGHMKQLYINTHYTSERDSWPPEQPKQFTSVVLLQHKGQPCQEHVITIEKAAATVNISTIVSAANERNHEDCNCNSKLHESLQKSRATKNVMEILNKLDDPHTNPRTLLIEGAPGIGKTFLLRHLAFEWAHNRMLTSSQSVFLLCLRDPAVRAMSSISDLVSYFYKKDRSARKLVENISEHLSSSGGKSVNFLLDGYDELPEHLQSDSFIADILNHEVLPASGVIVTSRPHATAHLHDRVAGVIKILGFAEENQLHYIEQSLQGKPEKITEVMDYLDRHPTINSLCYIPYHLTVLMFLYKRGYKLPRNSAELYEYFICLTIRRYFSKHKKKQTISNLSSLPAPYYEIIDQLAALSFIAIGEKQITFTIKELETACPGIKKVPEGINGLGLLQAVQHYGYTDTTTTFNFLHLTIQEYLAAYHVASLSPDEELLVLHENFYFDTPFDYNPYVNTFLMYVGLTKGQHRAFKHFLSGGGKYFGTGSQLLRRFFSPLENTKISHKFLNNNGYEEFTLLLFRSFYEVDDRLWYEQVLNYFCQDDEMDLFNTNVSHLSLDTIGIMLICKPEWSRLTINPGDPSCETFIKFFHKPLVKHSPIVHGIYCVNSDGHDNKYEFSIPCQNMLADIVIACKTTTLCIDNHQVDHPDWIEKVITHNFSMLKNLDLTSAGISSTTACKLFLFIRNSQRKNLTTLGIRCNHIDDTVAPEIAACLQKHCSLQSLNICSNPITGNGALQIVQALEFNDTLEAFTFPRFSKEVTIEILKHWTKVDERRMSLAKPSLIIKYVDY